MMDKQINVFMRVSVFLFILLAYTSVSHGQNPVTLERVKKATSPKKDNKHNSTTPLVCYIEFFVYLCKIN